jgi:serine protease Do
MTSLRAGFRWLLLGWLAGVCLAGPALGNDRLHRKVLAAFQEVVRDPARSTVQVYCDGYRAALGAIVREDGYIVTKSSELKGKIEVQLNDPKRSSKLPATLVAADRATDLAILKVDARNLPVIAWSDSPTPLVGSWLATPGLTRDPLAIGVVSVGPRKITAPHGALGIVLDEVEDVARIKEVREESPAAKAGLLEGDVIRKVNGKEIKGRVNAQETIRSYQPGDKVELVVERDGAMVNLEAVLGSLNTIFMFGERAEFQNSLGGSLSERRAGFPLAIQHDTVLRPAECGGPIVDLDGKAIGINIARAGRVESFALPAALVRETVEKLLASELTSAPAGGKLVGKNGAEGDKQVH